MYIVIVLVACIIAMMMMVIVFRPRSSSLPPIDIVVARYEEDVDWILDTLIPMLEKAPRRVIVYNKGRRHTLSNRILENVEVIDLPNVGREGHTYLHHICEIHGRGNDCVTMFLPGSCWSIRPKWGRVKEITRRMSTTGTVFVCDDVGTFPDDIYDFTIDAWAARESKNASANASAYLEPCDIRPFGKWFEQVVQTRGCRCISYGGMFAASSADINRKPKAYYERIKSYLDGAENPEAGHYVERSWAAIISQS